MVSRDAKIVDRVGPAIAFWNYVFPKSWLVGLSNLLGQNHDASTVTGGSLGEHPTTARSVRARILAWTGIVLVLLGIALPWWTFPVTISSGGPSALYGWQFGALPVVLAVTVLSVVVAGTIRRPSRVGLFCGIALLAVASASLLLSSSLLADVWSANCHVECFWPGPATPGIGMPIILLGAILVLAAQALSLRHMASEPTDPQ